MIIPSRAETTFQCSLFYIHWISLSHSSTTKFIFQIKSQWLRYTIADHEFLFTCCFLTLTSIISLNSSNALCFSIRESQLANLYFFNSRFANSKFKYYKFAYFPICKISKFANSQNPISSIPNSPITIQHSTHRLTHIDSSLSMFASPCM